MNQFAFLEDDITYLHLADQRGWVRGFGRKTCSKPCVPLQFSSYRQVFDNSAKEPDNPPDA